MEIIDISVPLCASTPTWPGDPRPSLVRFLDIDRGDPVNASELSCSVHTGTHVDAPSHHLAGTTTVDEMTLEAFYGPASVRHLRSTTEVTAADLEQLDLPSGAKRLLLKTSNSKLWARTSVGFYERFVALSEDAARWIVDRDLSVIGIDYLSVQRYHDQQAETHAVLLGAGVVILEGLDLTAVEDGEYWLASFPVKLRDCDGAPVRAVLIRDHPGLRA